MKLLVVGGTGFLGTYILKRAHELGWITASLSTRSPHLHRKVVTTQYFRGDLLADEDLRSQISDFSPDYVVNCAGYVNHSELSADAQSTMRTHFKLTSCLLDLFSSLSIKRYINVGSSDEYGLSAAPQSEIYAEQPFSTYSLAKSLSTHTVLARFRLTGFPGLVIRPFLLFGPMQDERRFIPYVIQNCLEGRLFQLGRGDVERDFLYITDAVDAIISLLEAPNVSGQVFNLASGIPVSISTAVDSVRNCLGGLGQPDYSVSDHRRGQNSCIYADISRITNAIGWTPKTPFLDGIEKTIAYYKNLSETAR